MDMEVVGIGALNFDILYKIKFDQLPQIQKRAERTIEAPEFLHIKKSLQEKGELVARSGGGSAANTIYALAKAGFSCGFVGKVGKDSVGDLLLQELQDVGVDTSNIARAGKSGVCCILLDENGERSVLVLPGTNDSLPAQEVDLQYINQAKILHATSFIGETSFQTQKKIILETKIPVSFDPGEPYADKGWNELLPVLKKTWIFFATHKEIKLITGQNIKKGLHTILDAGAKIAVGKLGRKGSFVISGEQEIFIPAVRTKSIDTTGAGDTYAAGFIAGILRGLPLLECGKLGTYFACSSIQGFGRTMYPEKNEVDNFIKKMKVKK